MRRLVKLFLALTPSGLQDTARKNCEVVLNAMHSAQCADLIVERDALLLELAMAERDLAFVVGQLGHLPSDLPSQP